MPDASRLRIFVSSPGDVGEERQIAGRVIERLRSQFANRVLIEPIFWEHEPLVATQSFQEQIPKPSEADIVICILWSRLGTRLPGHIARPDGSRYASGTEYEFEDAVEGHRKTGKPDLLVYRKTAEPVFSMNLKDRKAVQERLLQAEALDDFVGRWFHDREEGTLIAAFHPFDDTASFEEDLEIHLRKLIERRLPRVEIHGKPSAAASWTEGSPFRGLEAFDFEHAPIFFGRTKAVGDVLNALRKQAAQGQAFVMVLGMSGCGKSSLVRAGVLPMLLQPGVIEGVGLWRRAAMRPRDAGGDLFAGLAAALLRAEALPELEKSGSASELAEILREDAASAILPPLDALAESRAAAGEGPSADQRTEARLVLVIDQMEELFTLEQVTPEDRQTFSAALASLARSGRVWVLATLRSDFYHRCQELPELVALKEGAGLYDLLPPTTAEIAQMIRQPASAAGLAFEKDPQTNEWLDEVLRDAASKSRESLPLLEFALEELYKQSSGTGLLTFEAYRQLGGVEGALAMRAESVFAGLPDPVQQKFTEVFRALIGIGLGEKGAVVRKNAPMEEVCASESAKAFVQAFVDPSVRLFIADRLEDGTAVVSVAHEALMTHWSRLRDWIENDKEFLRVRARVSAAASRWEQEGNLSDLLLPEGKPLAEAEELLKEGEAHLKPPVVQFIKASRSAVQTRQEQERRRTRRVIISISGALVLALILAVLSFWQYRAASASRDAAEKAQHVAEGALGDAREARNAAVRSRGSAERLIGFMLGDLYKKIEPLGKLELLDDVCSRAVEYFDSLSEADASEEARVRQAEALQQVGWVRLGQGDSKGGMDAFQRSLQIMRTLVSKSPDNDEWQSELSTCYQHVGYVLEQQGDLSGALESHQAAFKIDEALAAKAPNDERWQSRLAISHGKLGHVLRKRHDLAGALAQYQANLQIMLSLTKKRPGNAASQVNLALSYSDVADVLEAQGDLSGALKEARASLEIVESLVVQHPGNTDWQSRLVAGHHAVGHLHREMGDLSAALEHEREAIKLSESLANRQPSNMQQQLDLAISHGKVGHVLKAKGDFSEALTHYRTNLEIMRSLVAKDPANALWQSSLALSYDDIGHVLSEQRDSTGALQHYAMALDIVEKLAKRDPDNASWQHYVWLNHANIADVLKEQNDLAGATRHARSGSSIAETQAAKYPEDVRWQDDLASSCDSLGHLLKAQKDLSGALEQYQRSLSIRKALSARSPDNDEWQGDLAWSHDYVGHVLKEQDDLTGAQEHYAAALSIRESLAGKAPDNDEWQSDLSWSHDHIGHVLVERGDLTGALEHYKASLEIRKALVEKDPKSLNRKYVLALSYDAVGKTLKKQSDWAGWMKHYRAGLDIAEELVGKDPANAKYEQLLSTIKE